MPKAVEILAALSTAVKSITVANGYLTNLDPVNVHTRMLPMDGMQKVNASAYPRVHIVSEGAAYEDMVSSRIAKDEQFTVLAVFAKNRNDTNDVNLVTQCANFVEDFEKWSDLHKQVGGSDHLTILTCATDAEVADTEAVVMFEINVRYRRNLRI